MLVMAVSLAAGEALRMEPALQRFDLEPSAVAEATMTVHAPPGTLVSMAAVDCACLRLLTTLPAPVPANGSLALKLRITGMRPGVEEVLVATSAGILRSQIQIVGPGAGRGRDQLQTALNTVQRQGWRLLALAHDLDGQVRNCGCSAGSLGGAGRLARLPALAAELVPGVQATWVLTGQVDGAYRGLGEALAGHGWRVGDASVRVANSDEVAALVQAPGVVTVIPLAPAKLRHRRLVEPVLTGGLAIELLGVDAGGQTQQRWTMPIDADLPDDPTLAARFPDRLTSAIHHQAEPSRACADCHASAYAAWSRSRHARALDSLPPTDRTDGCIGCHVTPLAPATVAPGVSCQSCHQGGAAHAASGGTLRTTGTTDCRSCHDAKHHPGFQREAAWTMIEHGREPAAQPAP